MENNGTRPGRERDITSMRFRTSRKVTHEIINWLPRRWRARDHLDLLLAC